MHWVDGAYTSECLGISLPDHNFVALLDEFDAVLEFESDLGLVIGLNELLVEYFDSLHSLPDSANMQNSLVACVDVRMVVQHLDLRVEIFDAEGLVRVQAFGLGGDGVY